jgi:hypothetical protein
MTEDTFLRALPLADRLRIAAVDLALTGAPRALVEAVWRAVELLDYGASPIAMRLRRSASTSRTGFPMSGPPGSMLRP